ncbi:hypothetical protein [Nitrosospira sp. NRS527]|nr:hypothetical protein [Nitrosospira sp. NRS527]
MKVRRYGGERNLPPAGTKKECTAQGQRSKMRMGIQGTGIEH